MKDKQGTPINVGDTVVFSFREDTSVYIGKVIALNINKSKETVTIEYPSRFLKTGLSTVNRKPENVII